MNRVVAIDGPSGSGKSTVSRGVAATLGLEVLDTGAMYRAATAAALRAGLPTDDGDALAALVATLDIDVVAGTTLLDGEDVSAEIRGPAVTESVSKVSAHPSVRAVLVARQRAWVAKHGGGVVEGRDIGSVVFPDACVKVFLTASDEERARRRQRDEVAAAREVSVADVRETMARRDDADATRAVSPLRAAEGATTVDTTGRSAEDIVAEIVTTFRAAKGS